MKDLKITFSDPDTGITIIVKNKKDKVFYHNSDIHDPKEFEELTGKVLHLENIEKEVIHSFYELAKKVF